MIVSFTPEAERQARGVDGWWRENRPGSPLLFALELAEAVALVSETPGLGVGHVTSSGRRLRKLLLVRTRHHVFFESDEKNGTVVIHAVWGAQRGTGPHL